MEVFTILGNMGGGGTVQYLHPKLIELAVMSLDNKLANCPLHGMQNALKNAMKNTIGDQTSRHGRSSSNWLSLLMRRQRKG